MNTWLLIIALLLFAWWAIAGITVALVLLSKLIDFICGVGDAIGHIIGRVTGYSAWKQRRRLLHVQKTVEAYLAQTLRRR